jgi:hypothetical protein
MPDLITPEAAKDLYWKTKAGMDWHASSGKVNLEREMELACWDVVIGEIRKHFEVETERLREENRQMKDLIVEINARDAVRAA